MYFYRPADGHGHGLAHDPLNAIVAPRPIGWIGTLDAQGNRNLAPFSFFNIFGYTPPLLGFATIGTKHSQTNAAATGEFTWNLVSRELAEQMNITGIAADVDEFAVSGLESTPGNLVAAPRVTAARVSFECLVSQIIPLTDAKGVRTDSTLVLGEVVGVHIDESLIVDGVFDTAAARPVLRGGGAATYFEATADSRFEMCRPQ